MEPIHWKCQKCLRSGIVINFPVLPEPGGPVMLSAFIEAVKADHRHVNEINPNPPCLCVGLSEEVEYLQIMPFG